MGRNNEWKFSAKFTLSKLTSVASMHGTLRAKLKVQGVKLGHTIYREIVNFQVVWDQEFQFTCTMTANSQGVLNPCPLKISFFKVSVYLYLRASSSTTVSILARETLLC